ncbi:uncharacterized protein LOC141630997 [Silene latifolia]|uniref:uncharacterized protein LOC141630997 n=1 Tax=Silene latifolia TaxID=37657 RepID=UPI003D76C022
MEMKDKVLKSGHYLFDNKPLIVKGWTSEADMKKDTITAVPVWIRLHKLPLKFWGKGLPKISNFIGKFIKSDLATEEKTRLNFARVMIELQVNQKLPDKAKFKDELGQLIQIEVEYEWKPVTCEFYKGVGHETMHCRWRKQGEKKKESKVIRKEWRPVAKKATVKVPVPGTTTTGVVVEVLEN